jgi:RNA polymerase sigma-70 factor (ECF subfamily)
MSFAALRGLTDEGSDDEENAVANDGVVALPRSAEGDAVVAALRAGDESAFGVLVERYRRELQVYCYRMLGSFTDAEDLVQETFLRAWRKRAGFEGRASFRAWLYRIATNACLDFLAHSSRRVRPVGLAMDSGVALPVAEVPWLQPYPDRLLDESAPSEAEPDGVVVAKETIELAFLAAIQLLTPRQRAVLVLRDVVGWSAAETASFLDGSVAAVHSALRRARAILRRRWPAGRLAWMSAPNASEEERSLVQRYIEAHERADAAAMVELLGEDVRLSMPPKPTWYEGRDAAVGAFRYGFGLHPFAGWRCVSTRANRQPAIVKYLRRRGDSVYRPHSLDVLRIENGAVVEITVFAFDATAVFGLPATL